MHMWMIGPFRGRASGSSSLAHAHVDDWVHFHILLKRLAHAHVDDWLGLQ